MFPGGGNWVCNKGPALLVFIVFPSLLSSVNTWRMGWPIDGYMRNKQLDDTDDSWQRAFASLAHPDWFVFDQKTL